VKYLLGLSYLRIYNPNKAAGVLKDILSPEEYGMLTPPGMRDA